jgi:DNA replication protein DnaC
MARIQDLLKRLQQQVTSTEHAAVLEHDADRARQQARRDALLALPTPLDDEMLRAIEHDTLEQTVALVAVRRFLALRSSRTILVLHGATGTGKSVAAADAAARRAHARWAYPRDLVEAYHSRYSEALVRRHALEQCPLLVIDSLGIEQADTTIMLDALVGLLPVRVRRRTIITTPLSQAAFLRRYAFAPLLSLLAASAFHVSLKALPTKGPDQP